MTSRCKTNNWEKIEKGEGEKERQIKEKGKKKGSWRIIEKRRMAK